MKQSTLFYIFFIIVHTTYARFHVYTLIFITDNFGIVEPREDRGDALYNQEGCGHRGDAAQICITSVCITDMYCTFSVDAAAHPQQARASSTLYQSYKKPRVAVDSQYN